MADLTTTSSNTESPAVLTIHDALALGQYEEVGRSPSSSSRTEDTDLTEAHRLPLLLRLLSASRSLASLPDLGYTDAAKTELKNNNHEETNIQNKERDSDNNTDDDDKDNENDDETATTTEVSSSDAWLDQVVQRLEDRAALYSAAEGVEVLAGHLAPHVCRKWSKLSPVTRKSKSQQHSTNDLVTVYDTSTLEQAIRGNSRRRKLSETSFTGLSSEEGNVLDQYDRMGVDEEDDEEAVEESMDQDKRKKRRIETSSQLLSGRTSVEPLPALRRQSTNTTISEREFAAEDSQQALATKSWTELALLVVQSLQQPLETSPISMTVDEASILAQATSSSTTRGLMSTDLSATLASLLHHTPVLRYDHVATALCRVGLHQAVDVCARLGANAPAAIPSLLHGCLVVAQAAAGQKITKDENHHLHQDDNHRSAEAASTTAWASVKALASLSPYERARACTVLRFHDTRALLLEFELTIERSDPLGLALFIEEHVRFSAQTESLDRLLRDHKQGQISACQCLARNLVDQPRCSLEWILPSFLCILALGKAGPLISFEWIPKVLEEKPNLRTFRFLAAIAWLGFCQSQLSENKQALENASCCSDYIAQLFGGGHAAFGARMICAWKGSASLGEVVLQILQLDRVCNETATWLEKANNLQSSIKLLEVLPFEKILEKGISEAAVLEDPDSVAEYLSYKATFFSEVQVRKSFVSILRGTNTKILLAAHGTLPLLIAVSKFLSQPDFKERCIPLVLPLQLERMGIRAQSQCLSSYSDELPEEMSTLLINLAYTLCFIHDQPESPYGADLRSLPVYALFKFLERMPGHSIDSVLRRFLLKDLQSSCDELVLQSRMPQILQGAIQQQQSLQLSGNAMRQDLANMVREALREPDKDQMGEKVEQLFCRTFGVVCQPTLCCTLASAFLSTSLPLSTLAYQKLCTDPLTLFKCPLTCWDRPGIRRVLLMVLFHLFRVNDALVESVSEDHEESAEEFRTSRNVLFVRCVLALMEKCPTIRSCSFASGFIRASVSECPGIGAAIVREGMGDAELDWFIINVPEVMSVGNAYQNLLALPTIPTASERLLAASAVLRISIIHGHRDEVKAQEMALSAISVLISNFFIVIGPVGVPVSTFVGEDKFCRGAALRMLKSISHVRGQRQGLRNECVMALQKLARLCKGEEIVGGLPASLANRQKVFLREMLDGINKALFALGSSL